MSKKNKIVRVVPQKLLDECMRTLGKIFAPEQNPDDAERPMCPLDVWCAFLKAMATVRKDEIIEVTSDPSVTRVVYKYPKH